MKDVVKVEPVYWRVHSDTKCVGWKATLNGKTICEKPTKQQVIEFIQEKE